MTVLSTGFYGGKYIIHQTTKCEIAATLTTDLQPGEYFRDFLQQQSIK